MKKFKKIYIEITNVCNLSCDFCPKTSRPQQFMSREVFERILQKLKGSTEHLYFHVMGEPLLHPDIGVFLDLSHKYDFKVNITTNGTLIDKVADSLMMKPALRQVNFSLHSFDANESRYSKESYINNIFEFIRKSRSEGKLLISLRLWNLNEAGENKENSYLLNRIEKEFGSKGSTGTVLLLPNQENRFCESVKQENRSHVSNAVKLAEGVYLNQAITFDWPDINLSDIGASGFCHGLRDQAAILVDGTVVPCCLDREGIIKLGNIIVQEWDEIIQSERARKLYEGFSKREAVEPLCRRCGYRGRFDG